MIITFLHRRYHPLSFIGTTLLNTHVADDLEDDQDYIDIRQETISADDLDDDKDYIDINQETFDCTCIDHVNKNGIGNCQTGEKRFENEIVCYVALPSSCPDLKKSNTDKGKFLSALPCKNNKKKSSILSLVTFPR